MPGDNIPYQHGLMSVLWIYPRGQAVKDEKSPDLIAGAAGVAACLGTNFVKINPSKKEGVDSAEILKQAVKAAGNAKVVCAGGSSTDPMAFLQRLYDQIHIAGASSKATGEISIRNHWRKPSTCAMPLPPLPSTTNPLKKLTKSTRPK